MGLWLLINGVLQVEMMTNPSFLPQICLFQEKKKREKVVEAKELTKQKNNDWLLWVGM